MINNRCCSADQSLWKVFIALAVAFVATFSYFIYINWDSFFLVLYESGDFAKMSLDVLKAKKFELLTGITSSQGVFRHPGPFLGYWYALWELVFCNGLGFPTPVIVHGIATAILNLSFQIMGLLIVYFNLRNKRLIIPCSLFLFLFMNTIVENQLAIASNIMIAMSSFLLLSLSSAHALTHRSFRIFPIFALAFTVCFHSHAAFGLTAIVISLPVFWKMVRPLLPKPPMAICSEDKRYLGLGFLFILIGFYPILYDQFFDTGNLSSIWLYIKNLGDISFLERINLYLGKALLFVSTFFVDMFWSKEFKLGLIVSNSYLTTPTISVLVWIFFGSVGFFAFSGRDKEDRFVKILFILVGIGILIGIYAAMGKTQAGRIFTQEYTSRYLLSFVAGFVFCFVLCLDRICSRLLSCSEGWRKRFAISAATFVFVGIGAVPLLLFPDSKNFFNKPAGINSGYFILANWMSTDPRIGEIATAIVKNGNRFDIQVEADQWPLLAGITARLMRMGYPVAINNETYSHSFKLKQKAERVPDTIIDSNSTADSDENLYVGNILAVGQSFKPSTSGRISSANFYIKKIGRPPGIIQLHIYAHAGVFGTSSIPTGSVTLAVSDLIPTTSLTGSYAKTTFNFTGPNAICLSSGTEYVVVLFHHEDAADAAGGYISVNRNSTPGSVHAGNLSILATAVPKWTAEPSEDLRFSIIGPVSDTLKIYLSSKPNPQRQMLYADPDTIISIDRPCTP